MIKRWTAVLLSLCLFICVVPASLAADTVVTAQAPESVPAIGETFKVVVSLTGNPGMNAAQFRINFDSAVVSCEEIEYGELLKNMLNASNPEGKREGQDCAIIASASTNTVRKDGELAVFTFKVVGEGAPDLSLTIETLAGLVNEKAEQIAHTAEGKGIVGKADAYTPPAEKPTNPTDPSAPTDPANPAEPAQPAEPTVPETPGALSFPDVVGHWAAEDIARAVEKGIVKGGDNGMFNPDAPVTRAQFVVMLHRMAGEPEPAAAANFTDVPANSWYAKQVAWAAEKGYVNGADGKFNPDGKLTREQAMAILFRYNGGAKSGLQGLVQGIYDYELGDSDKISGWAKDAVYWAISTELVKGVPVGGKMMVQPDGVASRAQISVILLRFMEK